MRRLIFLATLALASCGDGQQANNAIVSDQGGATAASAVNDITAIDAATADSANMAANVNYSVDENALDEEATNAVTPERTTARRRPARPSQPSPSEPSNSADTNTL